MDTRNYNSSNSDSIEFEVAHRNLRLVAGLLSASLLFGLGIKLGGDIEKRTPIGKCETTITNDDIHGSTSVANRLARPGAEIDSIIAGANDALAEQGLGSRNAQPGTRIVIQATRAIAPEKCDRYTSLDAR